MSSDILTTFTRSNAWDERYSLPLVPMHNNPAIYSAYALKVMRANGLAKEEELGLHATFLKYAAKCQVEPGLFNRWPDGGGGLTSHDEIMGMAYWSPSLARDILQYLLKTDGVYCNKPGELATRPEESMNVYRFIFLEPYLRACAGLRVGIINQLKFAAHVLYDCFTRKYDSTDDVGGMLRMWLMIEAMDEQPFSFLALALWKSRMKKHGWSPKRCYTIYLKECPVFTEYAPEEF